MINVLKHSNKELFLELSDLCVALLTTRSDELHRERQGHLFCRLVVLLIPGAGRCESDFFHVCNWVRATEF